VTLVRGIAVKELKKRGRPFNKERHLNEELIIYMAKALMREQGGIPSIRGLARALNVDAMAIYHYFDNKNSLLNAILTSLMDSLYFPQKQLYWQQSLLLLSESYLNLLKNYSGLLETLIAMPSDCPMTVFTEHFNKIVAPLNLPPEQQNSALLLLLNFLHGQALSSHLESSQEQREKSLHEVLTLYYKVIEY